MKIQKLTKETTTRMALLMALGKDPDIYDVEFTNNLVTAIDSEENFMDIYRTVAIRYTMDEAEALLKEFKTVFPDYKDDPYYKAGKPIYPIKTAAGKVKSKDIEMHNWTRNIKIYRHKIAGEWIYGLIGRGDDITENGYFIEAPMDGWEQWLADKKTILQHYWLARYS